MPGDIVVHHILHLIKPTHKSTKHQAKALIGVRVEEDAGDRVSLCKNIVKMSTAVMGAQSQFFLAKKNWSDLTKNGKVDQNVVIVKTAYQWTFLCVLSTLTFL